MQRREQLLAAALAVILAAFFGSRLVTRVAVEPIDQRLATLRSLENELALKREEVAQYEIAKQKLAIWRRRSLPSDPLNAQRLYQEWLDELAIQSGIKDIRIAAERRVTKGSYVLVQVSLQGSATLAGAAEFLDEFNRTDLLHRIARLEINQPNAGGDQLEVSLLAEGVALPDAGDRPRLFPRVKLAEPVLEADKELTVTDPTEFPAVPPFRCRVGDELVVVEKLLEPKRWQVRRGVQGTFADSHAAGDSLELAPIKTSAHPDALKPSNQVVKNDLFLPHQPGKRPTIRQPKQAPSLDPAEFTFLVASISSGEQRQAWLYDRSANRRISLEEGDVFRIDQTAARVLEIGAHEMIVRHDQANWRIPVGGNLRSLKRISDDRSKLSLH